VLNSRRLGGVRSGVAKESGLETLSRDMMSGMHSDYCIMGAMARVGGSKSPTCRRRTLAQKDPSIRMKNPTSRRRRDRKSGMGEELDG
jgi:hypothetical protein